MSTYQDYPQFTSEIHQLYQLVILVSDSASKPNKGGWLTLDDVKVFVEEL